MKKKVKLLLMNRNKLVSAISITTLMTRLNKIIKNKNMLVLFDQGIVSLSNFLMGILLARTLGIEGYGVYTLLWMIVLFFNNLQNAFIITPLLSLGPKQKNDTFFGSIFINQVIFTLCSISVLYGIVLIGHFIKFPSNLVQYIFGLSVVMISFQLQEFFRKYIFVIGRTKIMLFSDLIGYILQLVIIFIIYKAQSRISVSNVFISISISFLISISLIFILRIKIPISKASLKKDSLNIFNFGKYMAVTNLTQWLGTQGVLGLGGVYLGPSVLGGIRALLNLIAPINTLLATLQNILVVNASKIYFHKGQKQLILYLKKNSITTTMFLSIFGFFVNIYNQEILTLVYGQEYILFANLLPMLSIYVVIGFLITIVSIYYRSIEQTRGLVIPNIVACILSLLFTFLMIEKLGGSTIFYGLILYNLVVILCLTLIRRRETPYI